MSETEHQRPPRRPGRAARWAARHLDGWQAGALAVLIGAGGVFLSVPRAVDPRHVPAPRIDRRALAATMADDDELARWAVQEVLDVDIRKVGRELRRYNRALVKGPRKAATAARRATLEATRQALRRDERQLLALRAYQMKRFVAQVRHWQRSGEVSNELDELGGAFLEVARLSRWCTSDGRELLADEPVLRVFFKKRWNDVTGADAGPFALTLDEDRIRYAFLARYPMAPAGAKLPHDPVDRRRRRAYEQRARIDVVTKLGERDPDYPAALALGILHYRAGQFGPAADHFRRHLAQSPDGPYTLRARNYLKAALGYTNQGLF